MQQRLWIDTHVHIYPHFELIPLLDNAWKNFTQAVARQPEQNRAAVDRFILFVTEGEHEGSTQRLQQLSQSRSHSHWQLSAQPPSGMLASSSDGEIHIIFGHQLISSEGIELLHIGPLAAPLTDKKLPLIQLITHLAHSCLILPWGVGKWLGKRGKIINQLLTHHLFSHIILSDNKARPWIWCWVPQFRLAKKLGIPVLAGTDPLPLTQESSKVASFGSTLTLTTANWQPEQLAQQLPYWLKEAKINHFGKRASFCHTFITQCQLRMVK